MCTYISRQRQGKTHGEWYKEGEAEERIMRWQKKERQQGNQRGERNGETERLGAKERQGEKLEGRFSSEWCALWLFSLSLSPRLSPPCSKRSGCGLYLPARRNSIWDNLLGSLSPDAPQGHRIERMNVKEDRISKHTHTHAHAQSAGIGTHNCRRVDFTLVS